NTLQPMAMFDRSRPLLAEAERLAGELGDRRRLGWTLASTCHELWFGGNATDARPYGQRALAIAAELGDGALAAAATYRLGQMCLSSGSYREASERLAMVARSPEADRIREHLGAPGHFNVLARAWLAWALGECGEFAEAITWGREAVHSAEASGRPHSLGW